MRPKTQEDYEIEYQDLVESGEIDPKTCSFGEYWANRLPEEE